MGAGGNHGAESSDIVEPLREVVVERRAAKFPERHRRLAQTDHPCAEQPALPRRLDVGIYRQKPGILLLELAADQADGRMKARDRRLQVERGDIRPRGTCDPTEGLQNGRPARRITCGRVDQVNEFENPSWVYTEYPRRSLTQGQTREKLFIRVVTSRHPAVFDPVASSRISDGNRGRTLRFAAMLP